MKFAIILLACFVCGLANAFEGPVVKIDQGQVLGKWSKTYNGRQVASFLGIPYAKPPIGKNRFKEPQKADPWIGVWDATEYGSACLQIDRSSSENQVAAGSEDCLFVNIYTPDMSKDANLPVVVFIHGGAFMFGAGSYYQPTYLLDKDVVLVTMNYRLGVFGFLSTEDGTVPGNMGLKDQSASLHWVQKNIRKFGGNPDSVTITGLSAGGASVHHQYLSPLSKGTFHRGVAFSGSALNPWTLIPNPLEKTTALATKLGCPTKSTGILVECLRQRPGLTVLEATRIFDLWQVNLFSPFAPVVEHKSSPKPFLNKHPYQALLDGDFANVPFITSVTSEEGLYPAAGFTTAELLDDLERNWESLASYIFVYNDTLRKSGQASVASNIKAQYMNGKPISRETLPELIQALGDRHFGVGVEETALLHAKKSTENVYFYRFQFRGDGSLSDVISGTTENFGVSHGDDVFYIFDTIFLDIAASKQNLEMAFFLIDLLYSFAVDGVPKVGNAVWEPVSATESLKYLEISSTSKVEMKQSKTICHASFWKSLGFKENEIVVSSIKEEL